MDARGLGEGLLLLAQRGASRRPLIMRGDQPPRGIQARALLSLERERIDRRLAMEER
ncbi:hypothetical protein BDW74DRAFT_146009 [Aspergillus multicolor]|uniref:uncharacterized protein n=1 Tax=Aspergillus multicolor TaxID=41759 RepID=UPI003CCD2EB3